MEEDCKYTSFDVEMGSPSRKSEPPQRLTKYQRRHTTQEEIKAKQIAAEERRKVYEHEKLMRIQERSEECSKINSKVSHLLALDAKRRGLPGTSQVKPISTREAVQSIKSLSKDFSRITQGFNVNEMQS
ncbi:stathmin-2-B-like [Saccostrea echinata]|uniref:stathmin-2-B-like n=1 Tax=Saccostrea echinata TaxID=191078 RepID=UPI002A802897|nr:stathmin-2-B-like [Saccostrea echinata]